MWTIHIRWKILYQIFICSWAKHDWDQYMPMSAWHSTEHFCRRCVLTRPSAKRFRQEIPTKGFRMGYINLDHNGNPVGGRVVTASSIPGDKLGSVS